MLAATYHYINNIDTACRHLLADGIYSPFAVTTRISAHFAKLLRIGEPQQFKSAAVNAIEELAEAIQSAPILYVVIYGSRRTRFAAELITSSQLAYHVKLVLTEKELAGGPATIPRTFLYQIDTDRYPFTDRLWRQEQTTSPGSGFQRVR